jgi:hypothetical protein
MGDDQQPVSAGVMAQVAAIAGTTQDRRAVLAQTIVSAIEHSSNMLRWERYDPEHLRDELVRLSDLAATLEEEITRTDQLVAETFAAEAKWRSGRELPHYQNELRQFSETVAATLRTLSRVNAERKKLERPPTPSEAFAMMVYEAVKECGGELHVNKNNTHPGEDPGSWYKCLEILKPCLPKELRTLPSLGTLYRLKPKADGIISARPNIPV